MSEAPERIWIEDEFGEGDDDQWTYGTWDVRNYRGYVVEYVRADIVQNLTAERDRLREALKPFAFFFDDDGEAKTMQQAWEIIYRDRVEDWVFYQEIVAARAALKGETP